jgi:hypothetical protein
MDVLVLLAIIALMGAVVALVTRPLRGGAQQAESAEAARLADLLAARDAKYREIRELELDRATGKLADGDFRHQDRVLRGEAIEILRELDRLSPPAAPGDTPD